jgi:hypothetical protein
MLIIHKKSGKAAWAWVGPPIDVKVRRFVLKPPELAAMLRHQWNARQPPIIGFPASIQALGSWGTKKPYLPHEHQSPVAPHAHPFSGASMTAPLL